MQLCILTQLGLCLHRWAHVDLVIQAGDGGQGGRDIDSEPTLKSYVFLVVRQARVEIVEPIPGPLLLRLDHASLVTVLDYLGVHYLPQLLLFLLDQRIQGLLVSLSEGAPRGHHGIHSKLHGALEEGPASR